MARLKVTTMGHVFYSAARSVFGLRSVQQGQLSIRALVGLFLFVALVPTQARSEEDLWGGIRTFAAELSADNQLTVTNSNATGNVKIVFDIATKTIAWDISYKDLTSPPTAIRLHGPAQPGTNAAPIIDLGNKALSSPMKGGGPITAAHVQYLLLGWTYVTIATARYPNGEIRGKVDVVPPPELLNRRSDAQ